MLCQVMLFTGIIKPEKTVFNSKSILKSVILILEIRLGNKNFNLHILFLSYRQKVNRNLLCMDSYLLHCIPIWIQFQYIYDKNKNERGVCCLKMFGLAARNHHNMNFQTWVMCLNHHHKFSRNPWNQKMCNIVSGRKKNVRSRSILRNDTVAENLGEMIE